MKSSKVLISQEQYIEDLLSRNGPDPEEYQKINRFIDNINPEKVDSFRKMMQPILHPGTIIGFSFTKPFGYNGDFFIIEKIYQHYINPDEKYRKWDAFFHQLPAAIAVVNRKKLAVEQFINLNASTKDLNKDVLILGSGPVTEVHEYLEKTPDNKLFFDLVDIDQRAIDYGKNKNRNYLQYLHFMNKNVIRFNSDKKYDMIWSAGLFDYFKDKHFVFLIKKFYSCLRPGGSLIIGNFNTKNPSKRIMEILGDWFLFHRSEDDLTKFALQADIPQHQINVMAEPLGINLFLCIRR